MAITVYTYNDKVLKNVATDKWLKKYEPNDEVVIGSQTWKNVNLAIDDGGEGITITNGEYYYTQAAAQRVAATVTGWHLPTKDELDTLASTAGSYRNLAAVGFGNGTNSTGFDAKGVGAYSYGTLISNVAQFWSSTSAYYMNIYSEGGSIGGSVTYTSSTDKLSVRLIKDV